MTTLSPFSAVILAGGQAKRLNGVEKGLQHWQGKPLISHILARLAPQVEQIHLNINRNFEAYSQHYPEKVLYCDTLPDFQGPLSGILAAFEQWDDERLLFVPCDSPYLPTNLASKLCTALTINQAHIAYAHDGIRPHPTFVLLQRSIVPALRAYLESGGRRLLAFFQTQKSIAVDFSEQPQAFRNFNTPEDFTSGLFSHHFCNTPLLAITGYSGTGKTTLLEKLIPVLSAKGFRIGLIKHSHHHIDIDKPGKDSFRLRQAGANPTMVACDQRWAIMVETAAPATFEQLVSLLAQQPLDLILVEGFKHESLPKIQLHRQGISAPLPEDDPFTLATATDYPLARQNLLDINNVAQIAEFIEVYLQKR